MAAYYNENAPFAAAWLRELLKDNLIAPGEVDERSICDVSPDDLRGFTQVHLFAGIGGWSYALRLAGWSDTAPVWTGSCPCQPFSVAGRGKGTADARHLWPEMHRLLRECNPPTVFGEQVASKAGREWLAGVRADLEILGYAVGAADLCAAGSGAPHIRQRLWWVADSQRDPRDAGRLANQSTESLGKTPTGARSESRRCGLLGEWELPNSHSKGSQGRCEHSGEHPNQWTPWKTSISNQCLDGKARRVEPGIFPLAHGVSNRVGLLRGAGNAIVPQVAATFIQSYKDIYQ